MSTRPLPDAAATAVRPWLTCYDPDVPADTPPALPTVLDAFRLHAVQRPEHALVHYRGVSLDVGQVNRASDALAHGLAARGFGEGDRLAVYLQNVPQFVIGALAAWKLGGIVVTVNPMYVERELAEVLHDSGARVLLAEDGERLETARRAATACGVGQVIGCSTEFRGDEFHRCVDEGMAAGPLPVRATDPSSTATLIYTSGTTGPMKAAVATHAQIAYNTEVYRRWARIGPQDTIVAIAPLVHVTGLVGYLTLSLASAASLALTYRFSPEVFRDAVRAHRATFTIGPTTAFIALMESPALVPDDLTTLAKPYSGGAPIPLAVVQRYEAKFGHMIRGIYGMTEACGPTHMVPQDGRAPVDPVGGTLAVGLPVPGLGCRILDDDGNELPAGATGEVVLTGPQVASGYWQRPDATASTFTPQGLRTGDIGLMDAQGWLYVVDRKKDQINASGFKVWPREVEEALYEHPAVAECAVVGVPDPYRGENVRAHVVPRAGAPAVDAAALQAHCRERLAAYKVPREFVFMDQLPKTASGKILRRELRNSPAR